MHFYEVQTEGLNLGGAERQSKGGTVKVLLSPREYLERPRAEGSEDFLLASFFTGGRRFYCLL